MDQQKIIIGLVIGLLIGAGAGYSIAPSGTNDSSSENQITTLQNEVAQLESQKAVLETQLDNALDDVEESTTALESLTTVYNELQTQYDVCVDQAEDIINEKFNEEILPLQAEIESLTEELELLRAITPPVVEGDWNEIASFSGMGSQSTEYFFVPEISGVELRISWTNRETDSDKWISSIRLFEQGDDWSYKYMQLPEQKEGSVLIHAPIPTGQTYIEVDTWIHSDARWSITVEAWIPE